MKLRHVRSVWWIAALGLIAVATLTSQIGPQTREFSFCLRCDRNWMSDVIGNVALFLPLGAAFVYAGMRVSRAVLIGVAVSLTVELLQRVGVASGRTPSLDDWIANSLGTTIGAWLMALRYALVQHVVLARGRRAAGLLGAWTLIATGMFVASAWAVAPAVGPATSTDEVTQSWLATVPGFQSIQAALKGSVNGVQLATKTTGQIIAAAAMRDTMRVTLFRRVIDEKDKRDRLLPLAYVHGLTDTEELLMVGQFGDDAWLRGTVNATTLGLQTPALHLRGVFALDSVLIWKTSRIDAAVTSGRLTLRIDAPDPRIGVRSATLALTPALGWALIQPIVSASARIAPLLSALWMVLWFVPIGVWARGVRSPNNRERGPSALAPAVIALLMATVPLLLTRLAVFALGIEPLGPGDLAAAASGALGGILLAARLEQVGRPDLARAERAPNADFRVF